MEDKVIIQRLDEKHYTFTRGTFKRTFIRHSVESEKYFLANSNEMFNESYEREQHKFDNEMQIGEVKTVPAPIKIDQTKLDYIEKQPKNNKYCHWWASSFFK